MAEKKKFFITTAIDYVNAAPHIGHAYEKLLADIIARWQRLQGKKVHFLTGTDENAQKNEQAAREANKPIKEFINHNAEKFVTLCKKLNISYDEFIRTTEQRHIKKAQEFIKKAHEQGDIYKGSYEGLYCEGCEEFKTEKDLVDGKCPEHNRAPKIMSEEAYFFKLSKYQDKIKSALKNSLILPKARENEIAKRLEEEDLKDLCITRKNAVWGIDFPLDKEFKIYVWFDALVNYITGAGKKEEFWPADLQIVGKGIAWFHTVIWPAMLLSTGYKLPKNILVHGYLTVDGKKMSKSLGNVVDPLKLLDKYPTDSIRYFLVRDIPVSNDGDFSEEMLKERHNNELANKLGNLVSRVSTLAEKYGLEKPNADLDKDNVIRSISKHMENYELDKALHEIFAFVDSLNQLMQNEKPWETKNKEILYEVVDGIKVAAILISSFMPETADKIANTFNFDISLKSLKSPLKVSKIKKADILFKKIE